MSSWVDTKKYEFGIAGMGMNINPNSESSLDIIGFSFVTLSAFLSSASNFHVPFFFDTFFFLGLLFMHILSIPAFLRTCTPAGPMLDRLDSSQTFSYERTSLFFLSHLYLSGFNLRYSSLFNL